MKFLFIDDDPNKYDKEKNVKEAVSSLPNFDKIQIHTVKQNDKDTLQENIKDCDFIILDWMFPKGWPQGDETLAAIRDLGYKGPILIYTIGFQQFEEHIGPGKADDYCWHAWGIDGLEKMILRLLTRERLSETESTTRVIEFEESRPPLRYFKDEQSMSQYFYHSQLTNTKALNFNSNVELLKERGIIASTEWFLRGEGIVPTGAMGRVIQTIEVVANSNRPVVILGDTGTGKELVAKLLHYHHLNHGKRYEFGQYKKDSFLALNCGAFDEGTIKVELFGSLPGAFTDAQEKAGVFEQVTYYNKEREAEGGGTVFLDELGDMSLSSQAYFLRLLQENYVFRMGHNLLKAQGLSSEGETEKIDSRLYGKIPVNFRLVSATNKDLLEQTKKGKFRLDLFFRIRTVVIKLPPLRSRSFADFNLLFQFFLNRFRHQEKKNNLKLKNEGDYVASPSRDLLEYLWAAFPWTGNVRELEQLVAGIVVFSDPNRKEDDFLNLKDIPDYHWEMQR